MKGINNENENVLTIKDKENKENKENKKNKKQGLLKLGEEMKKYDFKKKMAYLAEIRHELKKHRIIFDEGKENFGLDEFKQLTKVKNTSEVKGYPFRGYFKKYDKILRGIKIALKIVPVETKYEKIDHPCNIEPIVLKELTDSLIRTGKTPHLTYYLGIQKVSNRSRAIKNLNLKRLELEDKIRGYSNMMISEYINGGSLDNWIFNTYENDDEISDSQWKYIVFQLIYTIAILQHDYKMMHNDFHYGNILIDTSIKPGGYFVYEIHNKRYYIPNTGIIPKGWDHEFTMAYRDNIPNYYPNKYIMGSWGYDKTNHKIIVDYTNSDPDEKHNVPYEFNEVYDLHYFLTSLLDLYISQELFDWIINLYPDELIPEEDSTETYTDTTTDTTDTDTTNITDTTDTETTKTDTETSDTNDYSISISLTDETTTEETNETESNNSNSKKSTFLIDGRLINGVEKMFNLPTPKLLLECEFFKEFLKVPHDFNEKEAVYFKSGF